MTDLVGMVGFRREAKKILRHKGSPWGLYEVPNLESYDVEETLLKEMIKAVRLYEDFDYVRTVQNAENIKKINLFEKLGFRQYGREERSMKIGEEYFDQVTLRLDLKS